MATVRPVTLRDRGRAVANALRRGPRLQLTQGQRDHILASIEIRTRQPYKWRFVDLETGDVWLWEGRFRRAPESCPDSWRFRGTPGDLYENPLYDGSL